jgi:hypothetical protein
LTPARCGKEEMTSDASSHRHVFSSSKELAREVVQRLCVLGEPSIPGGARMATCVYRPHSCERKKRYESSPPPAHHQPPATMKKWVARKSSTPTYARPVPTRCSGSLAHPSPLTVKTGQWLKPRNPGAGPSTYRVTHCQHRGGRTNQELAQPASHPPTHCQHPRQPRNPRCKTRERVNVKRQFQDNAATTHVFLIPLSGSR